MLPATWNLQIFFRIFKGVWSEWPKSRIRQDDIKIIRQAQELKFYTHTTMTYIAFALKLQLFRHFGGRGRGRSISWKSTFSEKWKFWKKMVSKYLWSKIHHRSRWSILQQVNINIQNTVRSLEWDTNKGWETLGTYAVTLFCKLGNHFFFTFQVVFSEVTFAYKTFNTTFRRNFTLKLLADKRLKQSYMTYSKLISVEWILYSLATVLKPLWSLQ